MSNAAPSGSPRTDLPDFRASISGRSTSSVQSMYSNCCFRRNCARRSAFSLRSCRESLDKLTLSPLDVCPNGPRVFDGIGDAETAPVTQEDPLVPVAFQTRLALRGSLVAPLGLPTLLPSFRG